MTIRGGPKYIPKDVMKEIENIRIELSLEDDSEALRKMATRSGMFRELKMDLFIKRRK